MFKISGEVRNVGHRSVKAKEGNQTYDFYDVRVETPSGEDLKIGLARDFAESGGIKSLRDLHGKVATLLVRAEERGFNYALSVTGIDPKTV